MVPCSDQGRAAGRCALGKRKRLALRILRRAAGLVQADLLALDLARVARHEAGLAQRGLQRLVVLDQRAGEPEADRAGLAGDATALDRDVDVELLLELRELERLAHDHARRLAAEERVERLAVDDDRALARLEEDARGRRLAATGTVILRSCHFDQFLRVWMSSGCGICAACGCDSPL